MRGLRRLLSGGVARGDHRRDMQHPRVHFPSSYSSLSHPRSKGQPRRTSLYFSVHLVLLLAFAAVLFFLSQRQIAAVDRNDHSENWSETTEDELWDSSFDLGYCTCVQPTRKYEAPQARNRYLTVRSNGGLNQMRTGICDMVAVARIMNATLVVPELDRKSFWKDSSSFGDIFDELNFIKSLEGDVRVIKELPKEAEFFPRIRKHFSSWASMSYYEDMANLLEDNRVIHAAKSDSRLANNNLPLDIQRLRCRCLYNALQFSPAIETLGKKLVERLRSRGKYIALHLRFEKDMLSFTGCTHDLTESEAEELRKMRESTSHWKTKTINSTEQRLGGLCPLTPKEAGIFLHSLGYPPSTCIYIAAGEIYGGDARLSALRFYFPNLIFKESLATPEEMAILSNHATRGAALDYILAIESDVFVATYTGNMARAVEGHRRFLGHRRTISPDRKGLVDIFDKLEKEELTVGPALTRRVHLMHRLRQGGPRRRYGPLAGVKGKGRFRTEECFYENPLPECICKRPKH